MNSITIRCCVAVCAALASSKATALELTINGDFETGDTNGWVEFISGGQSFVTTTDAAGGTTAGLITNPDPGTPAVIKQANIGIFEGVEPGQEVMISFDAKGVQGPGGVAFAEFFSELSEGGTSSSEILGGGPLPVTDEYQTFNFMATTGPDVSGGVTLQFNAATGAFEGSTAELFIDNVSLTIMVDSMLQADFNGDGTVDLLDLDILGANFDGPGTPSTGDANGDGTVDLLDLDILGNEFGQSASATSTPEPTSALLAGLALTVGLTRRRRVNG